MRDTLYQLKFNLYALSVDIDWAPDYMIDAMADAFSKAGVKCTWFVTHNSPAIGRLKQNPLFELGIHPNFFPGSSHGSNEDEIIRYCLNIVPGARCVRMHALFQSSRLLYKLRYEYNMTIDSSLFIPQTPYLKPHTFGMSPSMDPLIRLPYFWEDDVECYLPERMWNIEDPGYHFDGMKIFNFHPVYVGLNADTMYGYEQIKKNLCGEKALNELSEGEINSYVNQGNGAGTLFHALLGFIKSDRIPTYTFSEIAAQYK